MTKQEAEFGIIGSLIYTCGDEFDTLLLSPEDFSPPNDILIRKILELNEKRIRDDFDNVLAVSIGMGKDGRATALAQARNACFSSNNLRFYSDSLKEILVAEKIEKIKYESSTRIKDGDDPEKVGAEAAKSIAETQSRYTPKKSNFSLLEACCSFLDELEKGTQNQKSIKTGIFGVDELSGGIMPGEYVILAGRPSSGKTTFALNAAVRSGVKVGFISLEMNRKQISSKIISMASLTNTKWALRDPSRLKPQEKHDILNSIPDTLKMAERFEFYDTQEIDAALETIIMVMRWCAKAGCELIVLDYLQLVCVSGETREREIGKISQAIKYALGKLKMPGIILSQLSRGNEKENRPPKMSDLRDSGSLEQDADIIWFLHSEKGTDARNKIRKIQFYQAKGRLSGIGFCNLAYHLNSQRFYDLEENQ